MVDIFSDDENLERFYVVHRNVRIIPKGLISYMVLIIQQDPRSLQPCPPYRSLTVSQLSSMLLPTSSAHLTTVLRVFCFKRNFLP